jgi:O-antigen/teichoic acid export membrane protein
MVLMPDESLQKEDARGKESGRRFTMQVAWTVGARLLMTANSVLAGVIVARWLGAEGLGSLAVLNVMVATVVQLSSAGLPSANTYFISRERGRLGAAAVNSLLFAVAAGGALSLAVTLLAVWWPTLFSSISPQLVAVAAVSIPFQLIVVLGLNVFLALGRVDRFNLLDLASQSFVLLNGALALIVLGRGLSTLVSLNTAASILVGLLIVWMIGRQIVLEKERRGPARYRPNARLFAEMLRYGVKFHVSILASILIFRADLLIVNHFRGASEAGVYAVASQVAMMLIMLPGVIGTLLMPRAASERDERGELTMRATRHTAFVMLFICALAVPAAYALPLLYGRAFTDATIQLLILLPGVYLVGIEAVLVQHFNSTGLPAAIPVFWLTTLVVNVSLNLALVPAYGARGAAVASTLSYALIFILVASLFRLRTGNGFSATLVLRGRELRELLAASRVGGSSRS